MRNPGARPALLAVAPALLLVPLMSVYRGYFQGMQEMLPTALSQLAEQVVRVACGLALAFFLLPRGLETAAAGAAGGGSIGPIVGILVLLFIYFRRRNDLRKEIEEDPHTEKEPAGSILKTIAFVAIPITIGVSIQPIMNLGDTMLVMGRLQSAAGFSTAEAEDLFGALTGFAIPVINVPMALALSMALAIVPTIAAAKSRGDRETLEKNIRLGLRTAMIIGVPCSFGLMCLAEPAMRLLFPLQVEGAVISSRCLFILSAGIVFLCVAQTMAGVLQGTGKVGLAVFGLTAGFAVKCAATWILSGIPEFGVLGAAAATVLAYAVIAAVNLLCVRRTLQIRFDLVLALGKPLAAGAVMSAAVLPVYRLTAHLTGNSIATLFAIAVGAAVYGVVLLKIRGITAEEIETMPKGKKLAGILRKCHLI